MLLADEGIDMHPGYLWRFVYVQGRWYTEVMDVYCQVCILVIYRDLL